MQQLNLRFLTAYNPIGQVGHKIAARMFQQALAHIYGHLVVRNHMVDVRFVCDHHLSVCLVGNGVKKMRVTRRLAQSYTVGVETAERSGLYRFTGGANVRDVCNRPAQGGLHEVYFVLLSPDERTQHVRQHVVLRARDVLHAPIHRHLVMGYHVLQILFVCEFRATRVLGRGGGFIVLGVLVVIGH